MKIHTTTCNRCGATDVTWMKSKRTGNNYLVKVYSLDGVLVADARHFHDCKAESDGVAYERRLQEHARVASEKKTQDDAEFLKAFACMTDEELKAMPSWVKRKVNSLMSV